MACLTQLRQEIVSNTHHWEGGRNTPTHTYILTHIHRFRLRAPHRKEREIASLTQHQRRSVAKQPQLTLRHGRVVVECQKPIAEEDSECTKYVNVIARRS